MSFRVPNDWDEVLTVGDFTLYYADYRTLQAGTTISNGIIDLFVKRIIERMPPQMRQKVFVCSSAMFSRLSTDGNFKAWNEGDLAGLTDAEKRHHHVREYFRNIRMLDFYLIIVPCYVTLDAMGRGHWLLAIIRNIVGSGEERTKSEILIFDSIRNAERAANVSGHLATLLEVDHRKMQSQLLFGPEDITKVEAMVS